MTSQNVLYYGDNLDILKRYVANDSVDLIYLDPPFNSNASYNILFKETDGARSASQVKAFEDTWRWDQTAARTFDDFVESGPHRASQALRAFQTMLGDNDLLAYLMGVVMRRISRSPVSISVLRG